MKKRYIVVLLVFLTVFASVDSHENSLLDNLNGSIDSDKLLNDLNADNKILNGLIQDYQNKKTEKLSLDQQEQYKTTLENYMIKLSSLENAGDELINVQQQWLEIYKNWLPYIVVDLDDEEAFQELLFEEEEGGLDDLEIVEGGNDSMKMMQEIAAIVYEHTQEKLYALMQSFSGKLSMKIHGLGSYTSSSVQDLDTFFNEALQNASAAMSGISKMAVSDYYAKLESAGIAVNLKVKDPLATKLEYDIDGIEYNAIAEMHALVAILKSADTLPQVGAQLQVGVDTYQRLAQEEFERDQKEASKKRSNTWFDDLKASGLEFIGDFTNNFEAEFKKALQKAVDDTVADMGEIVTMQLTEGGNLAATKAGEYLTPVTGYFTDIIGDEVLARLESYSTTEIKKVTDSIPGLLKKKALKELGIDSSEELGISSLKAVIRKKYPAGRSFNGLRVSEGTGLSQEEQSFVDKRMVKIASAQKQHFGIDSPLKIGLCFSGGGNRAMLASLGFLLGAEETGLLDSSLYNAGLSGSTWTVSPWSYLSLKKDMSLSAFKDQLVKGLNKGMLPTGGMFSPPMIGDDALPSFGINFAKRFAYDQKITTIDAYGGLIGNYSLAPVGSKRLEAKWSTMTDLLEDGNIPYPMGAAVSYKDGQTVEAGLTSEYYWFEVGPFGVGSDAVGSYVPVYAFGSQFSNGRPVDNYRGKAPEYPISYYEGVFGSAYAASANEIVDHAIPNPSFSVLGVDVALPINSWIRESMNEDASKLRMIPASFHNYTMGLDSSPIKGNAEISLYDGAMNFNFPLPLIMRPARNVSAVFVCDAGQDFASLEKAQLHFRRNNIAFPDMKKHVKEMVESQRMTVFNDPRKAGYFPEMVTIFYLPFLKNDNYSETFDPIECTGSGPCATFNFKYTEQEASDVVGLATQNLKDSAAEIKEVLQALAAKKS